MRPKLPVLSGEEVVRALGKFGYSVVRQKAASSGCGMDPTRGALL